MSDAVALRDEPIDGLPQAEYERKLVLQVARFVAKADRNEDARRKSDRIGSNLFYGRHWNITMPPNRAALTINFTKALILHKISIMTKQDPIPVIEATEFGDAQASDLLRQVVMKWWRESGMKLRLRRVQLLANCTRTAALKVCWDQTLNGGVGDVAVDVIPGWQLILDDNADRLERMQYHGNRAVMKRSEAVLAYPRCAKQIYANARDNKRGSSAPASGYPTSSIGDPWRRMTQSSNDLSTIVNGKPVISSYTMGGSAARPTFNDDDTVQIVEMFHRDRTMFQVERAVTDEHGLPKKRIIRDEKGMPKFREVEPELHPQEDGSIVELPGFELVTEAIMETRIEPKYPHWRRTTVIIPDMILVDDRAWDGPSPYSLFSDGDALEGPIVKGSALDIEDSQMALNVSLSNMMDNLRMNSYRPVIAGQAANIEGNTLLVKPGQIIRVGQVDQLKAFEFPDVSETWFKWCDYHVANMERVIGLQGVMQGEAAGRVDSAAGYDLLAEISGSRIVELTQRMEESIVELIRVVAWFMQRHYTDKHAMAVMDAEGNISEEKLGGAFFMGSFNFNVVTGSTMAWSESSVRARLLQELQNGIIDKVAYWQRTNTPDWQQIRARILQQPPALSGAAGGPPPRTRSAPKNATKPK